MTSEAESTGAAPQPERQAIARVAPHMCDACGLCAPICPSQAITVGQFIAEVDADVCTGCGACVPACPKAAIVVM